MVRHHQQVGTQRIGRQASDHCQFGGAVDIAGQQHRGVRARDPQHAAARIAADRRVVALSRQRMQQLETHAVPLPRNTGRTHRAGIRPAPGRQPP